MKWLVLLFVLVALLCSAWGNEEHHQPAEEATRSGHDFTSRYAELAAPVPAHVNVQELVADLQRAANIDH